MKKAIILGASGLIGGHLLELLLADERYNSIVAISRKPLNIEHKKLSNPTGDLFSMHDFKAEFQDGDDLFIAIGTTRAKTSDKQLYEKIDLGIPVAAANLGEEVGVKNLCVVSSMGANSKSSIFYSSLKGKMEDAIQALKIKNTNLVRPSLLLGDRDEDRLGENWGAKIMKTFDFLVPKKSKPIEGETVAKAMLILANEDSSKTIWMNDELKSIVDKS